ncbi:hypothetical protein DNK06_08925 [Pseudomonas daroniae]|uniref:DUF5625 domain-containing protein n=1 Tax=Phytopseudomonas daroniae TaxID=2487519 RepID=A0A4Q9QN51_9GAMM|nr:MULTISPECIES: hypothetical protein [Pseudomonas]TBU81221.1 hypothetical protein DNK06_08925 [Pseudomonas daroniae]TBU83745.1 hypothetical protein DNK31_09690 [Pseudomonas sp. FRB 228]TBU89320.1 hypothetical protein DNJ99_16425 [Pseudomonas daroniae]
MSHKSKAILWAGMGLSLLLSVVVLRLFSVWATTLPLDVPVRLDEGATLDLPVKARTLEFDTLAVVFSTGELPLYTVRKLSGGPIWENEQWVEYPPAPMTLGWKLLTPAGELLSAGQGDIGQELTSYGSDEITRAVARIPMEPGDYRLQVTALTPDARFAEVATRLVFVAQGKGETWQSGVAWWGSIISGVLLIPLMVICGLLTLHHFTRWRYGAPAAD